MLESDNTRTFTSIIGISYYFAIRLIYDTNDFYTYMFNTFGNLITSLYQSEYDPRMKFTIPQYTKAYIDFGDGNKMEFDPTKSATYKVYNTVRYYKIDLLYKEAIVPDITRYCACIDATWFNNSNNDGITVGSQTFTADMSLIFTLDKWSEFIANNKNFYAQGNFNTMMKINKGIVSGAAGAAGMNIGRSAASIANIYADTLQLALSVKGVDERIDKFLDERVEKCKKEVKNGGDKQW